MEVGESICDFHVEIVMTSHSADRKDNVVLNKTIKVYVTFCQWLQQLKIFNVLLTGVLRVNKFVITRIEFGELNVFFSL